jgi:cytochrome c oxidase assembly protein subunit 15
VHYDSNPFVPALVQFFHRVVAYVLIISGLCFFFKNYKSSPSSFFQKSMWLFALMLTAQVLLGIFTLINSKGIIPVGLGVLHQGFAILLLGSMLLLRFQAVEEKRW